MITDDFDAVVIGAGAGGSSPPHGWPRRDSARSSWNVSTRLEAGLPLTTSTGSR